MKQLLKFAGMLVLALSLFTAQAQDKKGEKTTVFKCTIDCHSCEKKIMTNIPYEKGVKDVKVSLEKQEVTIKYKTDKNTDEKLAEAIKKLGYSAEVKKETNDDKKQEEKK